MLQLYADFRVGGKPKFIFADKPPKLMFIPDEIRKSVVYVGYKKPNVDLSLQGTAFFVGRQIQGLEDSFLYLITAAHVIRGISSKDNFDGKILLRVYLIGGDAKTIETNVSDWKFHPDETEVDVAILPFLTDLETIADVAWIPFDMFLDEYKKVENDISIGDEVFLTGLFYNHHGRKRNIPIVRVGNISAMPEEKVFTKIGLIDAYLVEARSIGGISGSPVFVKVELDKHSQGHLLIGTGKRGGKFFLLGLMHGHYDYDLLTEDSITMDAKAKEVVNMGIAIVVPSEKIMEVINQPVIKELEMQIENKLREDLMPTMDNVGEDVDITYDLFENALKRVSRKTSELDQEKKETSD